MATFGKRRGGGGLVGVSTLARYAENPASVFETKRQLRAKRGKLAYGTRFHRDAGEGRSPVAAVIFILMALAALYMASRFFLK